MSQLDDAERRLERAVRRLERAAQQSHVQLAERAALAGALKAAQAEGASLRAMGGALSTRLDSVIGRLRATLES